MDGLFHGTEGIVTGSCSRRAFIALRIPAGRRADKSIEPKKNEDGREKEKSDRWRAVRRSFPCFLASFVSFGYEFFSYGRNPRWHL
jgi:hypothetical protein